MARGKGMLCVSSNVTSKQAEEIVLKFSKMLNRQIIMDIVEKPSLIGGFIAYIDGKVYDASIQGKLNEFEKKL